MVTGNTKKLFVTPEYLEQAVSFVLAKADYLSRDNLLLRTINPSFASDYELGGLHYSHLVGCYFRFMEWDETLRFLFRHERTRQLTPTYAFQFVEKLDMLNVHWVIPAAESSSSWADEGYILTTHLPKAWDDRKSIHHYLKKHGVGLIHVDPKNYQLSRMIYPAMSHDERDKEKLNRIFEKSEPFQQFAAEVMARLKSLDEL